MSEVQKLEVPDRVVDNLQKLVESKIHQVHGRLVNMQKTYKDVNMWGDGDARTEYSQHGEKLGTLLELDNTLKTEEPEVTQPMLELARRLSQEEIEFLHRRIRRRCDTIQRRQEEGKDVLTSLDRLAFDTKDLGRALEINQYI